MFSIKLLGSPTITNGQNPIRISRRKSRAFLYYLAANQAPLTRGHLLAFFWPDHERSSGQQILRNTLHELRKVFGSEILSDDETVSLSPEIDIDGRQFEVCLSGQQLELTSLSTALDLYRGDFLENFDLPDSSEFENWQTFQAQYFRRLFIRGLTQLSQIYEGGMEYPKALQALVKALDMDPLQEDLQRTALKLHYLAGDRTAAIRRYETLRKLLDEEMGVPPMAETRQVYQAIITDSLPTPEFNPVPFNRPPVNRVSAKNQGEIPFVGRAPELQKMHGMANGTNSPLVLIEGEAGIGKTRLAEEFIRPFQGIALYGAGHELEQTLPYQPIIEVLRSLSNNPSWPSLRAAIQLPAIWVAETSRLLPELFPHLTNMPAASGVTTEARLWEGVNQLLRAISQQRMVILFLDDIHWADASSLAMLGYLVRQPAHPAVIFLASTRPVTPRTPLAMLLNTLTRENHLARISLPRLSPDEILSFSSHFSATAAKPLAEWLDKNAEGTPYFLVELIRFARENGGLKPDGQVALETLSDTPVIPSSIYSLIQSRLNQLSDSSRRVLDAAVAIGRYFEFEIATRASGLSENAAFDGLDELVNAGLVDPFEGNRYVFHHNLTIEVAYREVGEARHRLMHRKVAEAIKTIYRNQLDSVAGLLAWHYAEGLAANMAAPFAYRAGQQAVRLAAWREAISFFEQALAGESSEKQRVQIFLDLGEACSQVGEPSKAADSFRSAEELARKQENPKAIDRARLGLAQAYLLQGRYEEAISIVKRVLEAGRSEYAAEAELIWGTALSLEGSDLNQAADHLKRAENRLYSQGKPEASLLAHIKFEQGSLVAQQGKLVAAVDLYRQALKVSQENESALVYQILAYNNLGYHLLLLGDKTAVQYAQAGLKIALEKGVLAQTPYLQSTLGEIALAENDLTLAETHFLEGLRLAEQFSIKERVAGLTANLGLIAIARGQKELAIHHLSTALAQSDTNGTQHLSAQIRIWLVPLLPLDEAHFHLSEARLIAESGNRQRLLNEISRLEKNLAR